MTTSGQKVCAESCIVCVVQMLLSGLLKYLPREMSKELYNTELYVWRKQLHSVLVKPPRTHDRCGEEIFMLVLWRYMCLFSLAKPFLTCCETAQNRPPMSGHTFNQRWCYISYTIYIIPSYIVWHAQKATSKCSHLFWIHPAVVQVYSWCFCRQFCMSPSLVS